MSVDVYLFFHRGDLGATSALRRHVEDVCEKRGWHYFARSVSTIRTGEGRTIPLVARDVAAGLYPRAHRSRVATLVVGRDPVVSLHPSKEESLWSRWHVPLRRFLEYKSCWIRIPNDATNDSWIGAFAGWSERVECESDHDPRCLPFHVFSGDGRALQVADRRRAFDDRYGSGSRRVDEMDSEWTLNPREYHGMESLHVAGYTLRKGCHWDVVAEEWRICTPGGVWRVKGHVNIYPDAYVRGRGLDVRRLE
jgi:hypothetical protein